MRTADDLQVERWEGEDWVITGFGPQGGVHGPCLTRREADTIVRFIKVAVPLIQADARADLIAVIKRMRASDCGAWLKPNESGSMKRVELMKLLDELYKVSGI